MRHVDPHARPRGAGIAGGVRPLVRRTRLGAARASIGTAGEGAGRPLGAADRTDRRRQDAGGISADPGGVERAIALDRKRRPCPAPQAHLHRPRHSPRRRAAHALHLAAQGARRRHRAQPRNAGRRDEPADPDRDAHRRHPGIQAPAPAPRSARHSAHHAGAARAAARLCRRALSVRLASARRARRTAFAGHIETRRSARARPRAAVSHRAGHDHDRAVRHRRRTRRTLPLSGATAGRRCGRGGSGHRAWRRRARSSRCSTPAERSALGRPLGAPCVPRNL